jgi:hypothetical protein
MSCSTPFLFSQMLQAKSLMLVVGPVNTLNLVYSCWSWLNTWLNLVEPCWTMLDLVTPACFFSMFIPSWSWFLRSTSARKKSSVRFLYDGDNEAEAAAAVILLAKTGHETRKGGDPHEIPMKSGWRFGNYVILRYHERYDWIDGKYGDFMISWL